MALELFNFVYNTLMQKANNDKPGNSLFLPVALSDIKDGDGAPYLPLKEDQWSITNIGGAVSISDDLATSWFGVVFPAIFKLSREEPSGSITQKQIDDAKAAVTYITENKYKVIAYPDIGPDLIAKKIQITGLANVKIKGGAPQVTVDDEGYTAKIDLIPNAYPDTAGSWAQPLQLNGPADGVDGETKQSFKGLDFVLTQTLCFVDKDENIVPPPPTLNLPASAQHANGFDCSTTGIAWLTMTNALVTTDSTVTVSSAPALQFDIASIKLTGASTSTPTLTLQNLDYQDISPLPFPDIISATLYYPVWSKFFKNLLSTGDAAQLITGKVNSALLDPNNRSKIADLVQTQISNVLKQVLDSTAVASNTAGANQNAVDTYMFNRARGALNDPGSRVYVPTQILSTNSPKLDPFTASNLSIPGPFKKSIMGVGIELSTLVLSKLVVNGLSNTIAQPADVVFGPNQEATATLLMGLVPPGTKVKVNGQEVTVPSPPLTASSPFSLNIQVSGNTPVPISGTLSISLTNKSKNTGLKNVLTSSGDDPDELQLTFTTIRVQAAPEDVTLSITLQKDDQQFEAFINGFLAEPELINAIISAINEYIPQELGQISNAVTRFARDAINNLG